MYHAFDSHWHVSRIWEDFHPLRSRVRKKKDWKLHKMIGRLRYTFLAFSELSQSTSHVISPSFTELHEAEIFLSACATIFSGSHVIVYPLRFFSNDAVSVDSHWQRNFTMIRRDGRRSLGTLWIIIPRSRSRNLRVPDSVKWPVNYERYSTISFCFFGPGVQIDAWYCLEIVTRCDLVSATKSKHVFLS